MTRRDKIIVTLIYVGTALLLAAYVWSQVLVDRALRH
jgi:hypothetical protein